MKRASILLSTEYPRVTQWMVARGLTQEVLAQHMGFSYKTMYNKLTGRTSWTLEESLRLKEILNVNWPIERLMERRHPNGTPWPRKKASREKA